MIHFGKRPSLARRPALTLFWPSYGSVPAMLRRRRRGAFVSLCPRPSYWVRFLQGPEISCSGCRWRLAFDGSKGNPIPFGMQPHLGIFTLLYTCHPMPSGIPYKEYSAARWYTSGMAYVFPIALVGALIFVASGLPLVWFAVMSAGILGGALWVWRMRRADDREVSRRINASATRETTRETPLDP